MLQTNLESDLSSESTLCSDFDDQRSPFDIHNGAGVRPSAYHVAPDDAFLVDESDLYPYARLIDPILLFGGLHASPYDQDILDEVFGNLGIDSHDNVYGEDYYDDYEEDYYYNYSDDESYDEEADLNTEGDNDACIRIRDYPDFNFELGKLKLVPHKNFKHKLKPIFECIYDFDIKEQLAIIRSFGPPKHENLVPFELENASHFAEWYHYFKTAYARTSPINQAYCTTDKWTFYTFFRNLNDNPFEKSHVVFEIEQAFSDTFKKCLGNNLQREYANRNLSRELVEIMVVRELAKKSKKSVIKERHTELYDRATRGDYEPYIMFLQAHEFPEEEIYDMASVALVRNITTNEDIRFYDDRREKFRRWGGNAFENLGNLVEALRERELLRPVECPEYDLGDLLRRKPEYKKYCKRKTKGKRTSKNDICLKFHPEYGSLEVPIHSSRSCQ